jgi:5-methylcytosine-specific restriction protein B
VRQVEKAATTQAPGSPLVPAHGVALAPAYSSAEFAAETGLGEERAESFLRALRRKKQVVLYGPSGTGKTWAAQRLARRLIAGTCGAVHTVALHPGCDYGWFVRGSEPGAFPAFCAEARRRAPAPCVLLLDDLHRVDVAAMLGELAFLLEYRGEEVRVAGGALQLEVPENVYLIGTACTAVRGGLPFDGALRRRFAFLRVDPDHALLLRWFAERGLGGHALVAALEAVDAVIGDPDLRVGVAPFLRPGDELVRELGEIWRSEVEPYLESVLEPRWKVDEHRWARVGPGILAGLGEVPAERL